MSINNSYRIQIIESDGETTRYNFECFIYKKEDLKIKVMDDKANITELEYGNDYNVENQFDYYNGGYFNLIESQKKGIYIVIYRETPIDQQINFLSLQAINPMNLTKMFDKLTVICQELNEQFYRSMKFDFADISLIEQDKPLDETNIKNIDKELNNDYVVALTLKYNQETSKWELTTSKTNPDDKKEQGSESDYGVYKIATTEETKAGEDDTKIITPLKLKNGIDARIATIEEAIEGINDTKYITPKTVNDTIKSYRADTETILIGEDNTKYITPNTLKATTDNRLDDYTKETIITNTIFQYKAETNYSIGQPCYALVNNEPVFYYSIKNNNRDNNPIADTEGNHWKQLKFGGDGSNLPIGSIITSTIPITDANLHLPDGARLSKNGSHKSFYDYMKNLKETNPNIFCTEEEYEETLKINETGNCGKYVITDEYIRLPTINGWIETTINTNANGTINQPGLPDHTHFYQMKSGIGGSNSGGDPKNLYLADYQTGLASASNPIYGRSSEVTPRGVKYLIYIVIGNELSGADELITQANQIIADIDLKQKEQDNKIEENYSKYLNKLSTYYMPDYTIAVSITGNFIAQYAGWLIGNCMTPGTVASESAINGIVFAKDYEDYQNIQLLMDKGDVFTTTAKNFELKFMKLKGEIIINN